MQEFSAIDYLRIDLANNFGLDKELWSTRIDWVKDNDKQLETLIPQASNPLLFAKGIRAYRDIYKGKTTNYAMSLDSTCSCLQILGILSRCINTCKSTNLININRRSDVYTTVQDYMNSTYNLTTTRDDVKYSLMPHYYGSKAAPKEAFKNSEALKGFYNTLKDRFKGAEKIRKLVINAWNPNTEEYTWIMPDGYTVYTPVIGKAKKKINIGKTYYVMLLNKPQAQGKGVSLLANLTQSVDAYIVRELVRDSINNNYELYTIHDSFWSSPVNFNKVRQAYKKVMVDLAKSEFFKDWLYLMGGTVTYKNNPQFLTEIETMEYFLS